MNKKRKDLFGVYLPVAFLKKKTKKKDLPLKVKPLRKQTKKKGGGGGGGGGGHTHTKKKGLLLFSVWPDW